MAKPKINVNVSTPSTAAKTKDYCLRCGDDQPTRVTDPAGNPTDVHDGCGGRIVQEDAS